MFEDGEESSKKCETMIATGFAQACVAINFMYQYLNPGAKAFPGHSSEKKL